MEQKEKISQPEAEKEKRNRYETDKRRKNGDDADSQIDAYAGNPIDHSTAD